MELPDKITFNVLDKSNKAIEGIIVEIKVYSGTKNPYRILSPKTDDTGKAEIKKSNFIGQYEDHWEMGLMDYNGTIQDAKTKVDVYLFDPKWEINNKEACLAWPLLKNEKPLWSSRLEQYSYLISCVNQRYKTKKQSINLSKVNNIDVKVEKKWFKA